jgi:hypothetical protein
MEETLENVKALINDPELPIHRILAKNCLNRDAIAGGAIRICLSLLHSALEEEGLWRTELAEPIRGLLVAEWQKHSTLTPSIPTP